jgi:hypothetical protein
MKSPLVRCPTCKRHIYAAESSCPFCARTTISTPGSIAVALTAAASLALAGCANDAPKNDPSTEVAPEARKTEATQAAPKPEPPPAPIPVATAPEPAAAPSASVATTATPPAPPKTAPTTTQVDPRVGPPVPAYGAPPPTVTAPPKPPPAAYGGPPPRKGLPGDPLLPDKMP